MKEKALFLPQFLVHRRTYDYILNPSPRDVVCSMTVDSVATAPSTYINPAIRYFNIVIVRLDRTIQNLLKRLDSQIKSGNDNPEIPCIFACRVDHERVFRANGKANKGFCQKIDEMIRRTTENAMKSVKFLTGPLRGPASVCIAGSGTRRLWT